ncbi:isovaleryl-CoA dehydrogenase [Pantoea sp. SIMBA_079]|uniref:isovaleryl-CoA dehydrogenase n=1 Tax=Pantoea sp. SIMBA_079 TaxID=3085817 RepID=UPI0025D78AD2|nr:isovaleryl-CoA dehydrogenase [uncultured Pantoea sp.]
MFHSTHHVFNQPHPLCNSNLFTRDSALCDAVMREGAAWDQAWLASVGLQLGSAESLELGRLANSEPPVLQRYDARGERIDEVRFHPAWHLLMQGVCASRLHNLSWQPDAPAHAMVARAARFILHAQAEAGSLCPVTMTHAALPLLQAHLPAPYADWRAGLLSDRYDAHHLPGGQKRGLLIGMGMTEKQGGTDVLSNTTRAEPLGIRAPGEPWRITGHKWFFSVPQSDAHLILAHTSRGLSCFFLPRLLPDGTRNALRIEQLKEKLGNRSNASAEVEFQDATGWLMGEEGEGVRLLLRMGGMTRFDCALGSHGLMRRALSVALHHAQQRQVMGKQLSEQPLMRLQLARQALQLEAQTALLLRLARAWSAPASETERLYARLFTPVAKFAICRAGMPFVAECMEVLGGIGYCEQSELPRLYREMPVNSIWEGSGNVMCLDILRVLQRYPASHALLQQEFDAVKGANRHVDRRWRQLRLQLRHPHEAQARDIAQELFWLASAAILLKVAEPPLADAWCALASGRRGARDPDDTLSARLLRRAGAV